MKYKLSKIKNRMDGTFTCRTSKSRVIVGEYQRPPGASEPAMLWLSTITNAIDAEGQQTATMDMHHVHGYLSNNRLAELVQQLEQRAESIERGETQPAHVERVDIRKTDTWQRFLREHPDFLKEHPQYLADLKGEPED